MDKDQADFNSFIKEHYPNTIKNENSDGSLDLRTSIFFKSLNSQKKSSIVLVGNFNTLYYGANIQFVHFAGKDSDYDNDRIKSESNSTLAEENFYLYSKKMNALKFFGVYRCKFIEDKPDVIGFFNKLNRDLKNEEYKLKLILVLEKVTTLKDLIDRKS